MGTAGIGPGLQPSLCMPSGAWQGKVQRRVVGRTPVLCQGEARLGPGRLNSRLEPGHGSQPHGQMRKIRKKQCRSLEAKMY